MKHLFYKNLKKLLLNNYKRFNFFGRLLFIKTRRIKDKKIFKKYIQELVKVKVKRFKVCFKISNCGCINFLLDHYDRAFKYL